MPDSGNSHLLVGKISIMPGAWAGRGCCMGAAPVILHQGLCAVRPASEMAGLRRLLEGMRQEMQALEDELYAAREERAVVEMERAGAADEADAAAAALAAAERRQADLVAAVDEVGLAWALTLDF